MSLKTLLIIDRFEAFDQVYEERFERRYGFFRSYPPASPILGPNGYDNTVSVRIGGSSEVRRGQQCGQVSVVVDGLRLRDLRLGKEALKTFYTTGVRDPRAVSGAVVAI